MISSCKAPGEAGGGLSSITAEDLSDDTLISQEEYLMLMQSHDIDPLLYDYSVSDDAMKSSANLGRHTTKFHPSTTPGQEKTLSSVAEKSPITTDEEGF